MRITLLVLLFFPLICWGENETLFPSGRWEGFQDLGIGGNAAFIMSIDSTGQGFYGYSLSGDGEGAVCFPINKSTMQKRTGYFELLNKTDELQFIVLITEQLLNNNYKAMTLLNYKEKRASGPIVWNLVPAQGSFLNEEVFKACNEKLKGT